MPSAPSELTLAATLPVPGVSIQIEPPLVDLLFDQPAAPDADLVFGAGFIAPRDYAIFERVITVAEGGSIAPAVDQALAIRGVLWGDRSVAVAGRVRPLVRRDGRELRSARL